MLNEAQIEARKDMIDDALYEAEKEREDDREFKEWKQKNLDDLRDEFLDDHFFDFEDFTRKKFMEEC